MQPGIKTRVPLRTGESNREPRVLRLTIVFHPVLTRIGASMNLGVQHESSRVRLDATVVGRHSPTCDDGLGLDEAHISRCALRLKHHARGLQLQDASMYSHSQIGPDKASALSLSESDLEQGIAIRFGHAVVCWLRLTDGSESDRHEAADGFLGISPEAAHVRRLIRIAASSNLSVLIRGESGVGKEVAAQTIHRCSSRSENPWVAVNMAALPETLADTELFGSAKGAFTGAQERHGYFAAADAGTLFLDEIGDTPTGIQPKLLRALQTGEIQVVGGKPRVIDARIVAASDGALEDVTRFKHALLQRLAGITIHIPPLRERCEDIGFLLRSRIRSDPESAVSRSLRHLEQSPAETAAWAGFMFDALHAPWLGNAREYILAAERFALTVSEEASQMRRRNELPAVAVAPTDDEIEAVHAASQFEMAETARRLGMSRGTLYRRIKHIASLRLAGHVGDQEILTAVADVGHDLTALSQRLRVSKPAIAQRLQALSLRS